MIGTEDNIGSALKQLLEKRKAENSLRSLKVTEGLVDFCSNDYLGFARAESLKKRITGELKKYPDHLIGSTGSRLLSGNTAYAEELEKSIASFHHAEAGLIFNSGYDSNIGLFSCIAQRNDTIIYDELSHASIIDGVRLSHAKSYKFAHNDLDDLEKKLKLSTGNIFVAVESVYSMDGDFAPLQDLVVLCKQYDAQLIVDEAHATGIFGELGRGRVHEAGLENKVFARMHTFGKALGVHGAIVLGSAELREYLVNFARSFIYSTTLPFHSLVSIKCAYDELKNQHPSADGLAIQQLIAHFRETFKDNNSISPIQRIIIPGNDRVKKTASYIQENGFDVRPILSPTVPEGKERLRICLHTFNTKEEINKLSQLISLATGGD